jgi:hypothetical protein
VHRLQGLQEAIIEPAATSTTTEPAGPLEFSGNGEPTEASYGVLQFGTMKNSEDGTKCEKTDECIDESLTSSSRQPLLRVADVPQVPVVSHP